MEYIITEAYNGSWCTCRYGVKAWLCRPIMEGDYVVVNINETFVVTRWQRSAFLHDICNNLSLLL